ncbi:hypothetical protein [Amycolatopsis sp. NBC_01286]|uniref:hypothetical protein n=1 Tax=Amycolatopsis sp. NBC_01286 TaxID=2903560 RepID=UPI002E139484|nr:hypothetical protein OG570_42195 [Amycolatopsis sp. NBC_01286]
MAGDGTWDTVLQRLLTEADAAGLVDWAVSLGSTIAQAHRHATNITRPAGAGSNYTGLPTEPPDHAIGRSRGGWSTKVHHWSTAAASRWWLWSVPVRPETHRCCRT